MSVCALAAATRRVSRRVDNVYGDRHLITRLKEQPEPVAAHA